MPLASRQAQNQPDRKHNYPNDHLYHKMEKQKTIEASWWCAHCCWIVSLRRRHQGYNRSWVRSDWPWWPTTHLNLSQAVSKVFRIARRYRASLGWWLRATGRQGYETAQGVWAHVITYAPLLRAQFETDVAWQLLLSAARWEKQVPLRKHQRSCLRLTTQSMPQIDRVARNTAQN